LRGRTGAAGSGAAPNAMTTRSCRCPFARLLSVDLRPLRIGEQAVLAADQPNQARRGTAFECRYRSSCQSWARPSPLISDPHPAIPIAPNSLATSSKTSTASDVPAAAQAPRDRRTRGVVRNHTPQRHGSARRPEALIQRRGRTIHRGPVLLGHCGWVNHGRFRSAPAW